MLYQGTLSARKGEFPCCWGDPRCAQRVALAPSRHPQCAQGEFPCCWGDPRCAQRVALALSRHPRCAQGEFPCCWGEPRCAQRVVLALSRHARCAQRVALALSRHPRCAQGEFPCCWGDARCEQKGRPMRAKGSTMPPTLMGKKISPHYLRSKVKRAFASSDGFCIGLSHDCL